MAGTKRSNKKNPLGYVVVLAIVALIVASALMNRDEDEGPSVVYARDLMGTIVELTLMEGDRPRFAVAAEAGFAEVQRLSGLLSNYDPDSDASRINRADAGVPVRVAPEVAGVVAAALEVAALSNGAFDPTIGALAPVWGYSGESGRVPTEDEVKALLPLVDYTRVSVDLRGSTVEIKKPGIAINLGGVAKGFIVGRVIDALRRSGVTRGIVRAGGDMTVFQPAGGRAEPFTIGIRHPRRPDDLMGEVYVVTGAVATSGDYERFFEKDGRRYHHILDPGTGFPAEGSMSVTVVSADPTLADALSTAVFVKGPVEGMRLIEELKGVEGVIVSSSGNVLTSSGFRGRITGL